MTQISIINQPFGGHPNRVGDHLISLLDRSSNKMDSLYLAVAFARLSGVGILFDHFQDFVNSGSTLDIAVGIDQMGTSRQCLELLHQTGATVYVFHNPGGGTFHPKFYLFQKSGIEGIAIVGSNNITRGGLYENFEYSVRLDYDLTAASDAQEFQSFLDSFRTITNLSTGMAKIIDQNLIQQMDSAGLLLDESRTTTSLPAQHPQPSSRRQSIFSHVPMPRGPQLSRRVSAITEPTQPGTPLSIFLMTLGIRDTRQQTGFSRDIFIPIAARNANVNFWDWNAAFTPPLTGARGNFLERRVDLQVTPVSGITRLVRHVRIYYYAERDEFRINCSELIIGATQGDILVISRVQAGAGYDYDAVIIARSHPLYTAFLNLCNHSVTNSGKIWGYA